MTEPSRIEDVGVAGQGALGSGHVSSLTLLIIMALGVLLIQPRLSDRREVLHDRDVLTADEVAALPQGTLPVVLGSDDFGQDQDDFRYRLLKLVLERSGTPFSLGFSAGVQPQDEAIAALLRKDTKAGRRNPSAALGRCLWRRAGVEPSFAGGPHSHNGWNPWPAGGLDQSDVSGGPPNVIRSIQGPSTHRHWCKASAGAMLRFSIGLGCGPTPPDRRNLLRLVNDNRVQLFPRGVAELEAENSMVRSLYPQMVLDSHLLIIYPFAGFFYVAPENTALAGAIQIGFERVIADGSYQRLVEEVDHDALVKASASN